MSCTIREAADCDLAAIRRTTLDAFGPAEGGEVCELVAALLSDPTAVPLTSLVAEMRGEVVGHVLLSGVRIGAGPQGVQAAILAPLSVVTAEQNQGVGGALVEAGVEALSQAGTDLVFVLGHPGYYPKFGFKPASPHGLEAPYVIPAEHADAWMVLELTEGALVSAGGRVVCADALMDPRHWTA